MLVHPRIIDEGEAPRASKICRCDVVPHCACINRVTVTAQLSAGGVWFSLIFANRSTPGATALE
jgi:hypothetical protein